MIIEDKFILSYAKKRYTIYKRQDIANMRRTYIFLDSAILLEKIMIL
jgi:hypothetical protein